MKKAFAGTLASAVFLTVGLAAVPSQAAPVASTQAVAGSVSTTDASVQDAIARIRELVPNLEADAAAAEQRFGLEASEALAVVRRAVEPSECPATTPLTDYVASSLSGFTQDELFGILILLILDPVKYDALVNAPLPPVYGVNGEFTQTLTATFKDLARFWDIDAGRLTMLPMKGSVLLDHARMTSVFRIVYGQTEANAQALATTIANLVNSIPKLNGGNHPILSFNAFATSADEIGGNRIAMGDGVLTAFQAIGLGDVAPRAILAHEYGHQVQYANNLIASPMTVEEGRRVELMADAYSAYFLTHARGDAVNSKRVQLFLATYYNVGDCGFTAVGHHGTPAQRQRAGEWAYGLATIARPQGDILPGLKFSQLFDAALPTIIG